MKVLLVNHTLHYFGGSETFTYTLAIRLMELGHDVFCFSPYTGEMAGHLRRAGVTVTDDLMALPSDIDIIHAHHRLESFLAYSRFSNKPMIIVCHGILPWQEQPLKSRMNVYRYVAVSEEVKDHLYQNNTLDSTDICIIRNGIDFERFYCKREIQDFPGRAVIISNRMAEQQRSLIESVCKKLDIQLESIGLISNPTWYVENHINDADLVFALGRSALEAMACKRGVIVFDYNGGDGFVTPDTFGIFRKKNFSGRTGKINFNEETLVNEIIKYSKQDINLVYNFVREEHDIRNIAQQYLDLYQNAIENFNGNRSHLQEKELKFHSAICEIVNELDSIQSKDISLLKSQLASKEGELSELQTSIQNYSNLLEQKKNEVTQLQGEIRELAAARLSLLNHEQLLAEIRSGLGFKALQGLWRFREFVFPVGSFRRGIYNLISQGLKIIMNEGWESFNYKLRRKVGGAVSKKYKLLGAGSFQSVQANQIQYACMVSVIIPIYDRTDLVKKSIESILNQDFQDFELILACDGSPQETLDIVNEYQSHPKVRIFKWEQQSGNAVKGRNIGISNAKGKYIAFQDSDDIAEPDRLRISVEVLERGDADIVYGAWRVLAEWDSDPRNHGLRNGEIVFSSECDLETLKKVCVPCQTTVMARSSALRIVGGLKSEMQYREDHELWLRLSAAGYRFRPIRSVLASLRLHPNNLELNHVSSSDQWLSKALMVYRKRGPILPRIAFVIPPSKISGGVAVVCQYAYRLQKMGFDVTIISEDDQTNLQWFPYQPIKLIPLRQARGEMFDVLFATGWSTAYIVEELKAERRFYFIQSDESRFFPTDEEYRSLAFRTYSFDLEFITIAQWLQHWLKEKFKKETRYVPNGLDHSLFHPALPLQPKGARPRILLEGPIDIPFKGMKNAFEVVNDLDCEVWCVSTSGRPRPDWRCDRFFTGIPINRMKHIYSSCDIFLKMSEVEGVPCPPLEMMACGQGACVVGEVTGIEEYIEDGKNALVVRKGDIEGAKKAIISIIENKSLRKHLIENGLRTAKSYDWDKSADLLHKIICPDDVLFLKKQKR